MIRTGNLFIGKLCSTEGDVIILFLTEAKMRKKFNRNTFLLRKLALLFTTRD